MPHGVIRAAFSMTFRKAGAQREAGLHFAEQSGKGCSDAKVGIIGTDLEPDETIARLKGFAGEYADGGQA